MREKCALGRTPITLWNHVVIPSNESIYCVTSKPLQTSGMMAATRREFLLRLMKQQKFMGLGDKPNSPLLGEL